MDVDLEQLEMLVKVTLNSNTRRINGNEERRNWANEIDQTTPVIGRL